MVLFNIIGGVASIVSFAIALWLLFRNSGDRRSAILFFSIAALAVVYMIGLNSAKETPKSGDHVMLNGEYDKRSPNSPQTKKPFVADPPSDPTKQPSRSSDSVVIAHEVLDDRKQSSPKPKKEMATVEASLLTSATGYSSPTELEPITNSAKGFRIEIKACYLDRQNLRCPVLVTNLLSADHCLSIRAGGGGRVSRNSTLPSSIRDDSDNEFTATTITRGNQMSTGEFDVKFSAHDSSLLLLDFQVGPAKVKVLKQLALICNLCDWSHGFPFALEQVPVLRQAWRP